jgi:hypothetical protein
MFSRLSTVFVRVTSIAEVNNNMLKQRNTEAPVNSGEFDAYFRTETQKTQKLVKKANIKVNYRCREGDSNGRSHPAANDCFGEN